MKTNYKYSFTLVLLCLVFTSSLIANVNNNVKTGLEKLAHKESKTIVKEFDVSSSSDVRVDHKRGKLTVKYIDGSKGKIEATVIVKGEDPNDVQTMLNVVEINVKNSGNRIDIESEDNIKSWNYTNGIFFSKHKIVLKNGTTIRTKVEQVSFDVILYLPKADQLHLKTKYDDIHIESCETENIYVDIHSGKLRSALLTSNLNVKVKYGEIDLQQVGNLYLDSHDSKGSVGNLGELTLKDKYSEFTFGNIASLDANLHDSDLLLGMISGDANIADQYSEIKFESMKNGVWNLHDSKIEIIDAVHLDIKTKYTEFIMNNIEAIKLYSHDDIFSINKIGELEIPESKYTEYAIDIISNKVNIDYSHDDDFNVSKTANTFSKLDFKGKYSEVKIPLPNGKGYTLEGVMKYGDFRYSKSGLKETRYVKDNDLFEITAVSSDGKSDLIVNIEAHDCKINIEH